MYQKKPVNWALLELIQMKKKEDIQPNSNEKNVPDSLEKMKNEGLASYGDEPSKKKNEESVESPTRHSADQKRKDQFNLYPVERNTSWKRKELIESSANENTYYKTSTERTDLLVSDIRYEEDRTSFFF